MGMGQVVRSSKQTHLKHEKNQANQQPDHMSGRVASCLKIKLHDRKSLL
jgi:Na+-transporting methylmalonyl-CoA/oxaloacetate decarboxylase gamma subunit